MAKSHGQQLWIDSHLSSYAPRWSSRWGFWCHQQLRPTGDASDSPFEKPESRRRTYHWFEILFMLIYHGIPYYIMFSCCSAVTIYPQTNKSWSQTSVYFGCSVHHNQIESSWQVPWQILWKWTQPSPKSSEIYGSLTLKWMFWLPADGLMLTHWWLPAVSLWFTHQLSGEALRIPRPRSHPVRTALPAAALPGAALLPGRRLSRCRSAVPAPREVRLPTIGARWNGKMRPTRILFSGDCALEKKWEHDKVIVSLNWRWFW